MAASFGRPRESLGTISLNVSSAKGQLEAYTVTSRIRKLLAYPTQDGMDAIIMLVGVTLNPQNG